MRLRLPIRVCTQRLGKCGQYPRQYDFHHNKSQTEATTQHFSNKHCQSPIHNQNASSQQPQTQLDVNSFDASHAG